MSSSRVWLLATALLCLHFAICDGQNVDTSGCARQETCSACIQTPQCCWCTRAKESHCILIGDDFTNTCSDGTQCYSPASNLLIEKIEKEFGVFNKNETVQIRPQKVKLKMRVGDTYQLQLQYKQATDYPVDLYYLMDLSQSMRDDKDKLSALGNSLADAMKKLTKNFRMGFGSFVDKVAMPFVSTVPRKLERPYDGCVSPYSFKNHLPLNDDTNEFSIKVSATNVSGNLDSPEGGFDALMQAMVCTKEIGWREKARHLLVFSTDASFHLAGDGKLAGIVLPNDGNCHLNSMGEYDKALEYDYPSISQLNQKAQDNNINLIFAVTRSQVDLYNDLQARIKGASHGQLDSDSKNVIKLVQDQYEKLVDSVTLDNDNNEHFTVQYLSNCVNASAPQRVTKICDGTRVNVTVNYTAEIKVVKCPANIEQRTQTLVIKPRSVNENLTVEIEIVCDCPCEKPGDNDYKEQDEEACSGSTSKCGVCSCDEGREGRNCECETNKKDTNNGNDTACIANDQLCSGRGSCVCGLCKCNDENRYSGTYCECDNQSCRRVNKQLCDGHGRCVCGKCECNANDVYTGEDCSCENDDTKCIKPGTKDSCSGKGLCKCGRCSCNDNKYLGQYCDECPTCPGKRCEELSNCVECLAYKGNKGDTCATAGCNQKVKVELVDTLGEGDSDNGKHKCYRPDAAGCRFVFIYTDDAKMPVTVQAQRTKECGGDVNILAIVLGITGGTVIIGLLSLIAWKILTNIHDRREYVKFEKERALSKFDRGDNPLYKPSTSTFNNPTFGN